ncbi:MAG: hypothetical protein AAF264_06490 [Pseudomonadota bacterium]
MPRHYRNAAGERVSEFSKAELTGVREMGEETEEERRRRRLREEADRLASELAQIDDDADLTNENDSLEARVEALRAELEARRNTNTTKRATPDGRHQIEDQKMSTDLTALRTLDTLAKSATADHQAINKRAADLMLDRAEAVAKKRGIPLSQAHNVCGKSDEVYKGAYRIALESHDRAVQQHAMIGGMAPHM